MRKSFPTFSAENINKQAESMVVAYRTESTDQWTAASGITTKIPPLSDVSTSRFMYAELIDDWLNLTVLEAGKRRPALKNRLVGDAEMHKELLNRESLKAEDGVKYFSVTLRPHFIKGAQTSVDFIHLSAQEEEILRWSNGSASSLCS